MTLMLQYNKQVAHHVKETKTFVSVSWREHSAMFLFQVKWPTSFDFQHKTSPSHKTIFRSIIKASLFLDKRVHVQVQVGKSGGIGENLEMSTIVCIFE